MIAKRSAMRGMVLSLVLLLVSASTAAMAAASFSEEGRLLAVRKGLAALAKSQRTDGSIGQGAGLTALAGMAFLAGGHTPTRGEYRQASAKCLQYILKEQDPYTGYLGNTYGNMYSHGFAALYLAECYGMTADKRVRRALEAALNLIYSSQNSEGGWRYQPMPVDADISVTICQVMALRAAYNIGVGGVQSEKVLAKAVEYVRKCIGDNGAVGYTPGSSWGSSGVDGIPRAAAAAMSLIGAGITDPKDRSFGPVMGFLRKYVRNHVKSTSHWYWYGQYYASQAMFHSPKKDDWEAYANVAFPTIMGYQDANGHWTRPDNQGGSFATSMALIILQIPNNYLPIFQR